MSSSAMKHPNVSWLVNKAGRLVRRAWTGDVIRRRPKHIRPPEGIDVQAMSIAYNPYGAYCVPLDAVQRPAARAIMGGRVWEEDTLKFLAANMKGGDVVHAGAFFGDFFPFLSGQLPENATLWSFEPNSINYEAARLTGEINRLKNLRLFNAGLGPTPKKASLVTHNNRGLALGGASYVAQDVDEENPTEEIEILSLDALIPEATTVDIIQLDVEGYEEQALSGATALLNRCRPLLLLETLPSEAWRAQHLDPLGYRAEGKVDDNHILRAH